MPNTDFPTKDMTLSILLVVSDLEKTRRFYSEVLGAAFYREYGGHTLVYTFLGTWLILTTGGPPTEDKPNVTLSPPTDLNTMSVAWSIKVPDCQAAYETLKARGAEFITPPVDRGGYEIRCFFRDPDGHLIELSETVSK
jgi:catechol 2,3-dioxygenase-like lactoylglutathione lyase family enzyme